MPTTSSSRWITTGLLGLAVYSAVLGYATRTPQPDQTTDPDGWARFVTSGTYLLEHVASSVVGPVLAILGTVALGALLSTGRAPRLGVAAMVVTVTSHVLFMVPGTISTFATPAIGNAYLHGNTQVMTVTFPDAMTGVVAVALLLAVAGTIAMGVAIWRSGLLPRWTGALWITAGLVFNVLGFALGMATTGASLPTQPVGAALMAVTSAGMAWSVIGHTARAQRARPGRPDPDTALSLR